MLTDLVSSEYLCRDYRKSPASVVYDLRFMRHSILSNDASYPDISIGTYFRSRNFKLVLESKVIDRSDISRPNSIPKQVPHPMFPFPVHMIS